MEETGFTGSSQEMRSSSKYSHHIAEVCEEAFFRTLNTSDQKLFWKTVHLLTSNSPSVPTLIHDTGKAVSGKEKAELLSEFFGKCFTSSLSSLGFADLDTFSNTAQQCPDDFL